MAALWPPALSQTALSQTALSQTALAQAAPPAAGGAVRDTLDAVFRLPAFRRPLQETFWGWVGNLLSRLWRLLRGPAVASPTVFWLVVGVAVVAVVYAATRAAQRREGRVRAAARRTGALGEDPRRAAERAAAGGDYAAAVHHLYAAVLDALVARGLVRAHPAKTAGDYARELRRASARPTAGGAPGAAAAGPYAAFARGYEAVVYGPRAPDRARYEALRAAATPLLDPPRRTAAVAVGVAPRAA